MSKGGKPPAPIGDYQQFPAEHPAFRFRLPASWVVDRGNNDKSMLICNARGRGDIGLLCLGAAQVFSMEDFAGILPGLAKDQLDRQNISDIQIVSQGADQAIGCPYYYVIAKGKLSGKTMSVTMIGLIPAAGRGFIMEYALPSADGPAHMKDFQTILTSIEPTK